MKFINKIWKGLLVKSSKKAFVLCKWIWANELSLPSFINDGNDMVTKRSFPPNFQTCPIVYSPNEKARFYERSFFEKVIVMVKDTRSIKISFMHYMKRKRVMLLVIFKELEFCVFAIFFFSLSLSVSDADLGLLQHPRWGILW